MSDVQVAIIAYLLAHVVQYPAKLSENKREFGSRFRGLPRKEQIYTILPMGPDEIYHPRVFRDTVSKLKRYLSHTSAQSE